METIRDMRIMVDPKKNALNLIRMLAAIQVMYGHINGHLGIEMPWLFSQLVGGVFSGVPIFFTLSGFLIWFSLERDDSYGRYLYRRFLRIYPELWVAVVIEILTIVVLYSEYKPVELAAFTVTQATFLQFWTPESLRGYGIGTPNGALWTICTLIQFYVIAYFLYKFLKDKNKGVWVSICVGSVAVSFLIQLLLEGKSPEIIVKLYDQTVVRYLWLFLLGMFVARFFDSIIHYLMRYWYILLIVSYVVHFIHFDIIVHYGVVHTIMLFLGVIGFAYRFPRFNLKKDISYGVYIYHMIVVNIMATLGLANYVVYGVICFVISMIAGLISTETVGRFASKKRIIKVTKTSHT